ncbi:MAG: Ig-like domain-containing protein [Muribaculaceae bacterium]|nr:Ig-like domain-containing protein [Muribaculaceae bacterium]
MKKLLLSIATVGLVSLVAHADEYKFVFDGTNDMGGLTRQSDIKTPECVESFSLSEEGIDFSITRGSDSGKGFALVNGGGSNSGIYISGGISSLTDTKITLTVPNGKISDAKLWLSGYAAITLDISFNGKYVESSGDGPIFYWLWSDDSGTETLSIELDGTFEARYIHSIELTYTPDLGGKKTCGLAFEEKDLEGILGKEFTSPVLSNPNSLDVEWSSSDENVAAVDADGNVTPKGIGQTVIAASTTGNDDYAAGNAKYTLTVIGCAKNLSQMKEFAPNLYQRVYVDFPMTVTYATGLSAFVSDSEGNAGLIENIKDKGSTSLTTSTIYKVGNVIPEGWTATNAFIYESVNWQGIPPKVSETVKVEYPEVTSVTQDDVDRVVILKDVTFESRTPETYAKVTGITPDNKTYEFDNTFGINSQAAGTYDVTCIVRFSKIGSTEYFYLAPLSYDESSSASFINEDNSSVRYYNLNGVEILNPENGIYIKKTGSSTTKVILK